MGVRISDILTRIKRPITLEPEKKYKQVTIKLHHKGVVLRGYKKGKDIKSNMYEVKAGDFILSGIDARNGAFGIVPNELDGAIVTNDFWYFDVNEDVISKHLFLEMTQTSWFDEICRLGSDGMTQRVRLQKNKFFNQEIDLPSREKHEALLVKVQNSKTNINALTSEITRQQSLLNKLKQQVFQDAISGRLTAKWREENPDEEPATALLTGIKAKKTQLLKDKLINKQKPLPPIRDDEIPFELPKTWRWIRLGEIAEFITSGSRDWAKYYSETGPIFVRMGNLSKDSFQLRMDKVQRVQPPKSGEGKRTSLKPGDILISITGEVGTLGLIPDDFGEAYINQHTGMVRLLSVNSKYFGYTFLTPFLKKQFNEPQRGMKNSFRLTDIQNLIVSLPPPNEIDIIIQEIEKALTTIEAINLQVEKSERNINLLMQAVLKEAFEG